MHKCICSFFSKTGHEIFLKLYMKLEDNSRKEVRKPDFPKKSGSCKKVAKVSNYGGKYVEFFFTFC